MAVQNRYSAVQNEFVRLYHTFEYNGRLINPNGNPSVEIVDRDGVATLQRLTSTMESVGLYYVDYDVPIDADLGTYYDRWIFQFTGETVNTQVVTHFDIHPKDAIINFKSTEISSKYTARMLQMMRDLSNNFIYEACHIPIHW